MLTRASTTINSKAINARAHPLVESAMARDATRDVALLQAAVATREDHAIKTIAVKTATAHPAKSPDATTLTIVSASAIKAADAIDIAAQKIDPQRAIETSVVAETQALRNALSIANQSTIEAGLDTEAILLIAHATQAATTGDQDTSKATESTQGGTDITKAGNLSALATPSTTWPRTPTSKSATPTKLAQARKTRRLQLTTVLRASSSGMGSSGYLASAKRPISTPCRRT
mmetsp:Transcript_19566/g.26439  ORF Transcript_19566/g.26439 Transcript_19566/m.26439 type:complete len:232 (+) Transcript_19566:763-1458(+)